jgi:hypothetical protein
MKKMLKITTMMLVLLVSVNTFAQRGPGKGDPEARATKMTEHLTEALDLNEEQAAQIKTIHLKYGERMRAMHEQGEGSKMRPAMQQMKTDIEKEIKAVLTEEQATKFDEMPKRRPGKHGQGKRVNKAHLQAMKQIKEEKVLPILLEQRIKLEPQISTADKERIAELRVEVEKKKLEKKAEMKERRAAFKKGERPSPEEMEQYKAERKQHREAMQNDPLRLEIKSLVEKYQADIEPLLAEVEPELKTIKEEAKAQFKGDRKDEEHRKHRKGQGKRKGDWSEADKAEFKAKKEEHRYAHFLLLDPNAPIANSKAALVSGVKVYPNPSLGESQLEYTLQSAGLVTIELHDKSGNLLKVIETAEQPAGKNKTTVNFEQYTTGIYYLVIKDADGKAISTKVIR